MDKASSNRSSTAIPDLLADARPLAMKVDTVPEGWATVEQIAEASGLSRSHANRLIQDCLRAGIYEGRKFKVISGCRVYPVNHYRKKR